MTLSIIVPCFNPQPNWHQNIIQSFELVVSSLEKYAEIKLVLVNDGSTTGIHEDEVKLLKKSIKNLIYISYEENQGKGHALRTGIQKVHSEWYIITDVDFPYEQSSIEAIFEELQKGSDVVLGYRNSYYYEHVPYIRKLISMLFRFFLKNIIGLPNSDTQCGLKGFNQKGRAVFLKTHVNGYLFDMEFVYRLRKTGLKITQVLAVLKDDIVFTKMRLRLLAKEFFNLCRVLITK